MKKKIEDNFIVLVIVIGVLFIISLIITLFALTAPPTNESNQQIRQQLVIMIGASLASLLTLAAFGFNKKKKPEDKEEE